MLKYLILDGSINEINKCLIRAKFYVVHISKKMFHLNGELFKKDNFVNDRLYAKWLFSFIKKLSPSVIVMSFWNNYCITSTDFF